MWRHLPHSARAALRKEGREEEGGREEGGRKGGGRNKDKRRRERRRGRKGGGIEKRGKHNYCLFAFT